MASRFFLSNLRPFPTSASAHSPLITSGEIWSLCITISALWALADRGLECSECQLEVSVPLIVTIWACINHRRWVSVVPFRSSSSETVVNELSAVCRRKYTSRMDEVTDTVLYSPTRSYQRPPSHSSVALSSSTHPGSSMLTGDHPENPKNYGCQKKPKKRGQFMSYHDAQDRLTTSDWRDVGRVTIDMLPEPALLELFNFYVNEVGPIEKWHTLVHVCRKWRNVVFSSPRRLGLQLFCTARKPVRDTLHVWPPLPIIIRHGCHPTDNVFAALKHANRVCEIRLWPVPSSQWENVLVAMKQPFPELTDLKIQSKDDAAAVVPDSFLGGFAPRLRSLRFERISFPGLPKLLSSATSLVKISLQKIPHSGYISPEAMVNCLSMLSQLAELDLSFISPPSCPNRESRWRPLPRRSVLPALRHLGFVGVSEYLEDLVAQIDSPLLDSLQIKFFHQLIFDTPQLTQFISRTPELNACKKARIDISHSGASVLVPGVVGRGLRLEVSCRPLDWQLSSLAQLCSSFPWTLISSLEHLYIYDDECLRPLWQDDIEDSQWLELLQPFIAVKNLHLSREFTPRIVPVLQELVKNRMTGVLPALQHLYLEEDHQSGPIREAIVDIYSLPFIHSLGIVSQHSCFRPRDIDHSTFLRHHDRAHLYDIVA